MTNIMSIIMRLTNFTHDITQCKCNRLNESTTEATVVTMSFNDNA